jgi:hypothetical protein
VAAIGIGCLFQVSRQELHFPGLIFNIHQDPTHCSASCNAHQRYGNQHGNIWLYQVCRRSSYSRTVFTCLSQAVGRCTWHRYWSSYLVERKFHSLSTSTSWFSTSKQFLQKSLKTIPGLTFDSSAGALSQSVRQLKNIPVRIVCCCSAGRQRDKDNRIRLLGMPLYTPMGAQSAKYGWLTHRFARPDLS